jgi:hypothetical protein
MTNNQDGLKAEADMTKQLRDYVHFRRFGEPSIPVENLTNSVVRTLDTTASADMRHEIQKT